MQMVTREAAIVGRTDPLSIEDKHVVLNTPMIGPWPGMKAITFGLGCFWGAERIFWKLNGVHSTQVGYSGGYTENPTYKEVCTGATGHTEVVRVVYDPSAVSLEALLKVFFESHDPTQGMRQGNDRGTQYRSAIFTETAEDLALAQSLAAKYECELKGAGHDSITTEIGEAGHFYYAETYHQQYLHKNPEGYCGIGGTGVTCPIPNRG